MIEAWHSAEAVAAWRITVKPGARTVYRARRVVIDFARGIARLEQQEARKRRRK